MMFDWLRELTAEERKTFIAAFGGWSVDALDYMVYSFVIPTLIAAPCRQRYRSTFSIACPSVCP